MRWVAVLLLAACVGCGGHASNSGRSSALGGAAGAAGATGVTGVAGNAGGTTQATEGQWLSLTDQEYADIRANACSDWHSPPAGVPLELELVVDTSQSMSEIAPGSNRSKWELAREVLLRVLLGGDGNSLVEGTLVGLLRYPNRVTDPSLTQSPSSIETCVDLGSRLLAQALGPLDSPQRSLLKNAMLSAKTMGATPTLDAYRTMVEVLQVQSASIDSRILLVTDGMPTLNTGCTHPVPDSAALWPGTSPDDQAMAEVAPIIEEIDRARSLGIQTIVLGAPGSEAARAWLSQAAIAGSSAPGLCDVAGATQPCHVDMTSDQDVTGQLVALLNAKGPARNDCVFSLPARSAAGTSRIDPYRIDPILTDGNGAKWLMTRHQGPKESCNAGYVLLSCTQLQLCPDSCRRIAEDPAAMLEIQFGCATSGPEPTADSGIGSTGPCVF